MTAWTWDREAEIAVRAVTSAARLLVERPESSVSWTKGSHRDIVTAVDVALEQHLCAQLATAGHPIVGEETAPDVAMGDGPTWVIDPIDGTANWVAGLDWYAISVALRVGLGWPVGAVFLPARNELYFSWRDGGYFNGRLMSCPSDRPLARSLVAAAFSGSASEPGRRTRELEVFGAINDASRGCLRLGSAAANLCAVARGSLQVAYGVDVGLWDVAGGVAVAEALRLDVVLRRRLGNRCDFVVGTRTAVAGVSELMRRAELWQEEP